MKLAQTQAKFNLIAMIIVTSMFSTATEVTILLNMMPENTMGVALYLIFVTVILIIITIWYYYKAKKEDNILGGK